MALARYMTPSWSSVERKWRLVSLENATGKVLETIKEFGDKRMEAGLLTQQDATSKVLAAITKLGCDRLEA